MGVSIDTGDAPVVAVISREESVADAVLRIPAYRALRFALPYHRIVSITRYASPFEGALLRSQPLFFDAVASKVPMDETTEVINRTLSGFGHAELVIDLRSDIGTAFRTAIGIRASRYISNTPGFFVRAGIEGFRDPRPATDSHRFHRLIEVALGRTLPFDGRLPVLGRAAERAATLLPPGENYFGIIPGPGGSQPRWPAERHIALAARLTEMALRPVYIIGRTERDDRKWISEHVPEAIIIDAEITADDDVFLFWLAHAIGARLYGLLGVDTGLTHLLASHGVPTITIASTPAPARRRPTTPIWWFLDASRFGSNNVKSIPMEAVLGTISDLVRWHETNGRLPASEIVVAAAEAAAHAAPEVAGAAEREAEPETALHDGAPAL